MLFGAFCFMVLVSLTAEAKKPGNVKWATTYMKIIHKMNKEDKNKNYSNLPYKYGLIYFDKDNIPELVVSGEYWTSMYTYDKRKKKAYKVMGKSGYGMHVLGYDYLPGKNVLRSYSKHSNGAISYIYFGKMKNHKIVSRYPKSLKMLMFDDKNKNGILDSNELPGKNYYYYYGNKEISKKEFDSYEIAGKYKPAVCGGSATLVSESVAAFVH